MEKVIFDTNALYNDKIKPFFRGEIRKFASYSEILIPDIVIGELENKYRRLLLTAKEELKKNYIYHLCDFDVDKISIDELISKEKENVSISYQLINLTNSDYLFKMKDLALAKLPPFVSEEKSDKGFKDAYIYFTIMEYLENCSDKYIFICTGDQKLKEALEGCRRIKVIKNFEEFRNESITQYQEDYFIKKLTEELDIKFSKEYIIDVGFNLENNHILVANIQNNQIRIEIDSGEILRHTTKNIPLILKCFTDSTSFRNTHSAIYDLEKVKNFLLDDEIMQILQASISNNQISLISDDDDIKQFIGDLYEKKKNILDIELKGNR